MSDSGTQDVPAEFFSQIPTAVNVPDPELVAKARAHGWMEDSALDYEKFNATISDDQSAWTNFTKVYEWNGEEGDVGPPNEALEQQLFKSEHHAPGDALDHILSFKAIVEGPKKYEPIGDVSSPLPTFV
jgi:ATP-dependent RNA helicase DDX3X